MYLNWSTMLPFDDFPPEQEQLPSRLADMHALFGTTPGRRCGACRHFRRFAQGTRWAKCDKTRQTSSRATDWLARNQACGLWEPESMDH
jgi:leucyl aminopeptidase